MWPLRLAVQKASTYLHRGPGTLPGEGDKWCRGKGASSWVGTGGEAFQAEGKMSGQVVETAS